MCVCVYDVSRGPSQLSSKGRRQTDRQTPITIRIYVYYEYKNRRRVSDRREKRGQRRRRGGPRRVNHVFTF